MGKGYKGSFLGFTFNKIHSSSLGITRTSEDTYSDTLVPTINNHVAKIPHELMRFTGTDYGNREIEIPFSFEKMTEQQLNTFKQMLNSHEIADLIFDELPYKIYSAKITGSSLFQYLAFDNGVNRWYNGEGKITFTCYYPYARSRYAFQEDYTLDNIPEWREDDYVSGGESDITYTGGYSIIQYDLDEEVTSYMNSELETYQQWLDDLSLLVDVEDSYDKITNSYFINYINDSVYINYEEWIDASDIPSKEGYFLNGQYNIYNAGDIDMPIRIWMRAPYGEEPLHKYDILLDGKPVMQLDYLIRKKRVLDYDYYYVIDTGKRAIMGYDSKMKPTGTIYNECIVNGDFFNLSPGAHTLKIGRTPVDIKYNYLYL